MKRLGKFVLWIIAAFVGLTVIVNLEKGFDKYVWPIISKAVGPTDNEIRHATILKLGGRYTGWGKVAGYHLWAEIPQQIPDCESNTQLQLLQRNGGITINSKCEVAITDKDNFVTLDHYTPARFGVRTTRFDDETFSIQSKKYIGGEQYEVVYSVKMTPSIYSVLLGNDADTVKGYSGSVVLSFTDKGIGPEWRVSSENERTVTK